MDTMIALWFVLTAASFVYVTWHNATNNPVSWVQKLAWILVTAYTGPIGLIAYWYSCRTRPGMTHEESTKPIWKQAVNSEMHCVAGDATGIIISAAIVYHFSLPNGIDLLIEYISGFVCGLFIFQALMMLSMYQGNYWLAVKKTFFAEAVSMNMVMTGMIPVMVILMHNLSSGDSPYSPNFWFTMGMATIAGGIIAYPINYWLVAKNLKHGCMTLEPPTEMEHHQGHEMTEKGKHEMGKISLGKQAVIMAATYAILIFVTYLTTFFAPIAWS